MNTLDPNIDECIEWVLKCGMSINFYTYRTEWQKIYCCTITSKIGSKVKTYQVEQASLSACLHHIAKNYKDIFMELSCPPWPKRNSMYK